MTKIVLATLFIATLCLGNISARAQSTRLDTAWLRHLPADASQVIRINLPRVLAHLNWSDFIHAVAQFCPQTPSVARCVDSIKNPRNFGLNFHKPVIIATGFNPDNSPYTSIIINLADSGHFISWLKRVFPALHTKTFDGGVRTASIPEANFIWDDQLAIISIGDRFRFLWMLRGDGSSPLTADSAFAAAFSGNTDLQMWTTGDFGLPTSKQIARAARYEHAIATYKFESGRLTFTAQVPLDSLGRSRVHLFNTRPLPEKWLMPFPKDELLGFVSLHIDTPAMGIIVDSNFAGSMLLSLINGQSCNISRALRGDVLIAAVRSAHPGESPQPGVNFYVIATIRDSLAMARLATSLGLAYVVRDTICVIASNAAAAREYFNAPLDGPSPLVSDTLRAYPFGGAIDLKALRVTYPFQAPAGTANGLLTDLLKLVHFGKMSFVVGYTANSSITKIELDCLDPGTGSLGAILDDMAL